MSMIKIIKNKKMKYWIIRILLIKIIPRNWLNLKNCKLSKKQNNKIWK